MSDDVKYFLNLKKDIEKAKLNEAKAIGALENIKKEMQQEFGCKSIKELDKLIKKKKEKGVVISKQMEDFHVKFTEGFSDI